MASPRLTAFPAHLSWLRLPAEPPDPQVESAADEPDATWAYAWPAGVGLGADLADLAECRGRAVADHGCGCGLLGFSALALGDARVTFADANSAARTWVAAVIAENRLADRAAVVAHRWGKPLSGAKYDFILGGDILYRPACFDELLGTIAASLAPDGACLLSDPRLHLEEELPLLGARHGLGWKETRMPRGYTLVRVIRHRP
jgi:predicted nicotinamide N-methyase